MSHSTLLTLVALILYATFTFADVTVHSSFLFLRTGDRTPLTLGTSVSDPTVLTPLGSRQLYSAGDFFRARYITNALSTSNTTSHLNNVPISGLGVHQAVEEQLYTLALDAQWSVGSALAFMQGFYPPFSIKTDNNGGNSRKADGIVSAGTLDSLGLLGNGSYVSALLILVPVDDVLHLPPIAPNLIGHVQCGWND